MVSDLLSYLLVLFIGEQNKEGNWRIFDFKGTLNEGGALRWDGALRWGKALVWGWALSQSLTPISASSPFLHPPQRH